MPSTRTRPSTTHHLSILVSRSGAAWVAECIEHHLATEASTRSELERAIALKFAAHETACSAVGMAPYPVKLAPLAVRVAYDEAPRCWPAWVFTPAGSRLRLTIREARAS